MLNYALGASHMALILFTLHLLYPVAIITPAPAVTPYTVTYTPDCYVTFPDELEVSAMPLTLDQLVTITYESPAP